VEKSRIVPIIFYHSIVDVNDNWQFRHLSCPVSIFDRHLKALRWANFQTISLQKLYDYKIGGNSIPLRSVVLTFDDGYLDNWVYAYPLLKKYGFQGTIFINPEFVDPIQTLRPNLEDAWSKRVSFQELPKKGFLSWQEMRAMENSGHIEIQSHALTHTWYFSSADIIDFHHPTDQYPWLSWNACPENKHLWMTEDQHSIVPWGMPVYQYEKSLVARRYSPDENLSLMLTDYVNNHGREEFFQKVDWRKPLEQLAKDYRQQFGDCGSYESDDEYKIRVHYELAESKQIIERELKKTVNFLCWPGGGYNDTSIRISKEVGYLASLDVSIGSKGKENNNEDDLLKWGRIFPPSFHKSETEIEYKGGLYLICLLNWLRGSVIFSIIYKILKLPFKVNQRFGFKW
jgi:peptidoglycan/xylan/chitin deacetylase (PgdA/CDA1 family)